jgi:alpha-L-rhamnosidase
MFDHGHGITFPEGFGDWCAPNGTGGYLEAYREPQLVNSALLYRYLTRLAELARVTGNHAQEEQAAQMAGRTAEGFRERYGRAEAGTPQISGSAALCGAGEDEPSHTGTALAVAFGLLQDKERACAAALLSELVREQGIDTGIYATAELITASRAARETAATLAKLLDDDWPGFGYQIDRGATTLWEQWNREGGMASHDHAMFAGITASFRTVLLGVTSNAPGLTNLHVTPDLASGLRAAAGVVPTAAGPFGFGYRMSPDASKLEIRAFVPQAVPVQLRLPGYSLTGGDSLLTDGPDRRRGAAGIWDLKPGAHRLVFEKAELSDQTPEGRPLDR